MSTSLGGFRCLFATTDAHLSTGEVRGIHHAHLQTVILFKAKDASSCTYRVLCPRWPKFYVSEVTRVRTLIDEPRLSPNYVFHLIPSIKSIIRA